MDWNNFETWRDILDWVETHKLNNLAERMRLNNDCWNSSGEFGRSQVEICDSIRLSNSEAEALEYAKEYDKLCETNYGLW